MKSAGPDGRYEVLIRRWPPVHNLTSIEYNQELIRFLYEFYLDLIRETDKFLSHETLAQDASFVFNRSPQ